MKLSIDSLRKIINEEMESIANVSEDAAGGHTTRLAQAAFDAVEDFMDKNGPALAQAVAERLKRVGPIYAKGEDHQVKQAISQIVSEVGQLLAHNDPVKKVVRHAVQAAVAGNKKQNASAQAPMNKPKDKMKSIATAKPGDKQ